MSLISIFNLLLLGVGFGFVIFWHELGHFLAAKWAKVRVEQFAVGFGNAIFSYRQGLGIRRGTSAPEYETMLRADPAAAASVSPTEYRLNWIPLGGYVKMLGQEDMIVPEANHEPDSYMAKTVGQRMVIISAGVVMNVILAAFGFALLYFIGFSTPAALAGAISPGGPAERAGLQVGDRIVSINDKTIEDFPKLRLTVALLPPDVPAEFVVQPANTTDASARKTLEITPEQLPSAGGMLAIGVGPTPSLRASDKLQLDETAAAMQERVVTPDGLAVKPGETIVSVDGQPVAVDGWSVLQSAVQAAGEEGREVVLGVQMQSGSVEQRSVAPMLATFAEEAFLGLTPLRRVEVIAPGSPLGPDSAREEAGEELMRPGDVILSVVVPATGDRLVAPSIDAMGEWLTNAGLGGSAVDITVLRNGERVTLAGVEVTPLDGYNVLGLKVGVSRYGMNVSLGNALGVPMVTGEVAADSPAADADVDKLLGTSPARIVAVAGEPVEDWYDVGRVIRRQLSLPPATTQPSSQPALASESVDRTIAMTLAFAEPEGGERRETVELSVDETSAAAATSARFVLPVQTINAGYAAVETERQTYNPLQATWWGVYETRDQILSMYLTLKRVTVDQTVSPRQLTGPVGIFHFGTLVTERGYDWLLWFLAMISANLAVVNFLPIPILDGGHMVFLLWEKITGKPPARAVQIGALYAGLALIGCMVLFVTFNDLTRIFS